MSGGEDDPLRSVKIEIHGILVAQQEPIGVIEIAHKYFDDFDYHLDPKKYKFNTLEDLLAAMPDTVVTVPSKVIHQKPKYKAVIKEETKDIQSLVGRQLTKEQALERKRNRSMPRQARERRPTQFGAAFTYNGRESRGQMPQKVAQQKMVPVSDQKFASRFSAAYNEEDNASMSEDPRQDRQWVEDNSSGAHNLRGQYTPHPEASGISPPSRSESARSSGSLMSVGTVESESAFYANGAHEENDKSLAILQQAFRNVGDQVFADDLHPSVKEIINFNPETFKVYEGQEGKLTVELMRLYSPENLRRSGPFIRRAVEHDLMWVGKTHNVLAELQRIDSISIVQMLSPSVFLAATRFGNECGERFRTMSKLLYSFFRENKFRRVTFFKPGMGCIIHCDGEFARAILLSQAEKAGYLHFACMDMNAVADVHYEDVFHILPEVETKAFPCNTFLARINGVGKVYPKYEEHVAETFAEQAKGTTTLPVYPCIIHYIDSRDNKGWKGYVIDFVFQNKWISQWLLKNKLAPRNQKEELIYAYTPAAIERIIQEMEAFNAFDMSQGDLREVAAILLINASVYPGFDAICTKICSPEVRPTFNEPWIGDVVTPPPAETGASSEESEQISHDDTPTDEDMNADIARDAYIGFAHGDVVPAVESNQCVAGKSPIQPDIPAVEEQHSDIPPESNNNQDPKENTYLTLKVLLNKILDECGDRRSEAAVHLASCGWNLINIAGDASATTTNELYSVLNDLASEVTR